MVRRMRAISVLVVVWGFGVAWAEEGDKLPIIPVFEFSGAMLESPEPAGFTFELTPPKTLYNMLRRIERAAKDDDVKVIVITLDSARMGWAHMQELRQAIKTARDKGKQVVCYSETFNLLTYQLATSASRIVMVPTGEVNVIGLHAEQVYMKGMLDKLHLSADMVTVGAYKGASEPFTRSEPSDEAKEMLDWLVSDLYQTSLETIAEGRGLSVDEVRDLIDQGPLRAKESLEKGLVDALAYPDEFVALLREECGDDAALTHRYGVKKGPELDFSNIFSLFKTFGEMVAQKEKVEKPAVAVVYVDGMIVPGETEKDLFGSSGGVGSTTMRRILDRLRDDDSTEAVVLRINSPGGSALASDIIWHAVVELNRVKPVVVSMGNVAASGGYYIAVGGGTIYAEPSTMTGSIGVLGGKLITRGLWEDWLGITFHGIQKGRNADLNSGLQPYTEEQRKIIRELMLEVYAEFKDRVQSGRGSRLKGQLEDLAGGRVYTGRQALEKGLVDQLGGLNDAIARAAQEARLDDFETRQYPEPEDFMHMFIKGLSGETGDAEEGEIGIRLRSGWTLESPAIRQGLSVLRTLDPQRADSVLQSLMRIELLGRDGILLVLPAEWIVR